jgi:hypothetical protein
MACFKVLFPISLNVPVKTIKACQVAPLRAVFEQVASQVAVGRFTAVLAYSVEHNNITKNGMSSDVQCSLLTVVGLCK